MRTNEKTVGEGGEGQPQKTACIRLPPSPIAFWFNFGSAFARLYLLLNEPQKEKNIPKNKLLATQATQKGNSVYGKRQFAATDHYFPLLAVWFFVISTAIKAITCPV